MPRSNFDIVGFLAGLAGGFSHQLQAERQANEARNLRLLQLMQANENVTVEPVNPNDVAPSGGLWGALTGAGGGRVRTTGEPITMVGNAPFAVRPVPMMQPPSVAPRPPVVAHTTELVPLSRPFAMQQASVVRGQSAAVESTPETGGEQTLEAVTVTPAADLLERVPATSREQMAADAEAATIGRVAPRLQNTAKGRELLANRVEKARAAAEATYDRQVAQVQRQAEHLLASGRVTSPELRDALSRAETPQQMQYLRQYLSQQPDHLADAAQLLARAPREQQSQVVAAVIPRLYAMGYKKELIDARFRPYLARLDQDEKTALAASLAPIEVEKQVDAVRRKLPYDLIKAQQTGVRAAEIARNKFLTLDEAAAIGAPLGTRLSDVAGTVPPIRNEDQRRAWNYGSRALQAQETVRSLESAGEHGSPFLDELEGNLANILGGLGTVVGTVGGGGWVAGAVGYGAGAALGTLAAPLVNHLRNPREQLYLQAKLDFIGSLLRRESGAAITVGEYLRDSQRYFPRVGDAPQVVLQKRKARERVLQALEAEAGRPFLPPTPVEVPAQAPGAPQAPAAAPTGPLRAIPPVRP